MAPHGQTFLEIDAHSTNLDGIYEMISTEKGTLYTVEFDVRSRGTVTDSVDEAVYLMWNDKVPNAQGYKAKASGEWTTVTAIVIFRQHWSVCGQHQGHPHRELRSSVRY